MSIRLNERRYAEELKRLVQLVNEAQRCEDLLLAVQKKLGSLLKKEIDLPSMGD